MNCWEILGIAETSEEGKIQEAYRQKLPGFHPEEDPEGFRRLRGAFEEALQAAAALRASQEMPEGKAKEVDMLDNREIRDFLKEAERIYGNYALRISPGEWEKLLSSPVCQDLETQRDAGWALLSFLMDHFYLPQACLKTMNQTFVWQESGEELKQHFPEDFVDRFLEKLEQEDAFRYDRMPLNADLDYDAYFRTHFRFQRALWERNKEEADDLLAQLQAMGIEHPDSMILYIRHFMLSGQQEKAWEQAKRLEEIDGEDFNSHYWYLRLALNMEDEQIPPEMREEECIKLIESDQEHPGYWQLLGDFFCAQKRLMEGLKALRHCYRLSHREWDSVQDKIVEIAGELSQQMEKDGRNDFEFADICWTAHRYDKVREVLGAIEPPEGKELGWLMMMADSCYELEDYEAAWKYRKEIWDGCDEEGRVEALYLDMARDCGLSGRVEEALELYCQTGERFGESAQLYYLQAKLLSDNERAAEAMEMCEKALKLEFHLEAFNLRTEILFDRNAYALIKEETGDLLAKGLKSAQVMFDYARALRKLDELEEAEWVLKQLDEVTGGSDVVYQELAGVYYDMDKPEEALVWIDRAIKARDILWRQCLRADCLRDLERYEEELAVYRLLAEQGHSYPFINYRTGRALEELDRFDEAAEYFKKTVAEDKNYGAAWDGLGDVLQKQKKWDEAEVAYKQGIDSGNLQAARDLCRLYKRTHQNEKAEEWAKNMLKKWSQDKSLLTICSDILTRNKKYDEAVQCMNRYMELYPDKTAYAYREIAGVYEDAKEYEKVREYYQKAIDADPTDAKSWRLFGKFLANEIKAQEEALPFLQRAVELDADSTYGYMKLGEVYEALGNEEEARRCYEISLKNYQDDMEKEAPSCCDYEGIADVLLHLGRFDEAQEMIKKAVSLESRIFNCNAPYCYEALEDLAKIEERKGNLAEALEWMKKAGKYGTTDYYPREIARLTAAIEGQTP